MGTFECDITQMWIIEDTKLKKAKYILVGLIISLFAVSFTTIHGTNTTWTIFNNLDSFSKTNNTKGQILHEHIPNSFEFDPQETNAITEDAFPNMKCTNGYDQYVDVNNDDGEYTKEQAEAKIKEAEDKVEEVDTKIQEAKTQEGYDTEAIEKAEDKLEDAQQKLDDAKIAFSDEDYKAAYEKAEDSIKESEIALEELTDIEEDGEYTKEQAEAKITEAEDKVEEVKTKIQEAEAQDGYDTEAIEKAEDKLEDAEQKLDDAKIAFSDGDYKAAYEKAEDSIKESEIALTELGADNNREDVPDDTPKDDVSDDSSTEGEEIDINIFDAFQGIQIQPHVIAFTAIGAIAVSNVIMLTNKKLSLKFIALVFKIGEAFFVAIIGAEAFFVAIGTVVRPPSIRNLKKDEVLTNDKREQIYEYIQTHEGAHFREIINYVDIGPFAGIWHLQVLEDFGFIVSRRFKHYKIYYPTGRKILLEDPRLMLKGNTAKAIFRFILKNPGSHQNKIAKQLGKTHTTINYNLKKLIKAKLVDVVSENGRKKLYINKDLIGLRDVILEYFSEE